MKYSKISETICQNLKSSRENLVFDERDNREQSTDQMTQIRHTQKWQMIKSIIIFRGNPNKHGVWVNWICYIGRIISFTTNTQHEKTHHNVEIFLVIFVDRNS